MTEIGDITVLLRDIEAGQPGAREALAERVYADLERMAHAHLRRRFGARAPSVTLEPAALVNESFLKLIRGKAEFDDRGHFFGAATRAMLQVLADYGRRRSAAKRRGGAGRVTVSIDAAQVAASGASAEDAVEVEALAASIERLDTASPRAADVVRLRIVWGGRSRPDRGVSRCLPIDGGSRMAIRKGVASRRAWTAGAVTHVQCASTMMRSAKLTSPSASMSSGHARFLGHGPHAASSARMSPKSTTWACR